jgi:hypothetical protein
MIYLAFREALTGNVRMGMQLKTVERGGFSIPFSLEVTLPAQNVSLSELF